MVETPYYIFCVNILFKCFFYFNKIDSVLFLYLIAYLTMICSMCNKKTGFVGDDWIMAVYVNDVCYCGECSLKKMGASSIDMNGKFVKKKKKKFSVHGRDWVWCCGNKIPKDMEAVGCSYCF